MGFGQVLGDQVKQGLLDSFGLGTAVKELTTPPLEIADRPFRGETADNFVTRQKRAEELSLTKEAYESSPYFRTSIPWERGMTEDRAAALAGAWDQKMVRMHFAEKQPVAAFMGQLFGQAFDPINYVPVFGPGIRAAAVAKAGSIAGRMGIAASEAAINTAAFSVLTSGIRSRFGDDVSFSSIMLEIATSALIGGAFGAGAGVLMRGQDARIRNAVREATRSLDVIQNKQAAVAILNDGIHGMATKGEVDISGTAASLIQRTAEDLERRSLGARALSNETALIKAADEPGKVVISPAGSRVEVVPEVVELGSLIHASGALQVRDRTRFESRKWVEETATTLNPALLMPDISSDRGAPLVGDDNIIDSGNGRVMALRRTYEAYPDKAEEYRSALTKAGFDVSGFERPVLISRRTTPLSPEARAQFNAESNARNSAAMSASEIAKMDSDAMSDDVLALATSAPVTAASNRGFVRAFLANIPNTEHGALVDAQGELSAAGAARLQNAVVAAAYADVDPSIMRRFTEATDDNSRTILGAMSDVAGSWARMRREIARGNIDPAFDPTPSITESVRLLNGWRDQASREKRPISTVIKEGMAQIDMMSGSLREDVRAMLRAFYTDDTFTRAMGRDRLAELLGDMTKKVADLGAPALFERPNVPLAEIIRSAQGNGPTDLFAPASALGFDEVGGGQGARAALPAGGEGRGQGAQGASASAAPNENLIRLRDLPNDQQALQRKLLLGSAPVRSLDETYEAIPAHQKALSEFGAEIGKKHGATFKNPGLKKRVTAQQKMERKRYNDTRQLTDLVRAGYVVDTPEQAEAIINDLAGKWKVVDEGWNVSDAGFFDRKLLVQFEDGSIGEVQMWHPDMFTAKEDGHKLYEQMRGLSPDDPKFKELRAKSQELYGAVMSKVSPGWRSVIDQLSAEAGNAGADGNISSKASSESLRPESITSAASTGSQGPSSFSTANAADGMMTAGRPSQSKNVVSMLDNVGAAARDLKLLKPDPYVAPEGLVDAEARVGKPESLDETAEFYGVDSETGEFEELADIDQIGEEGRLTPEDKAALAAAEQDFKNAKAYGKALEAAVRCVI
jgi:hypothetical protein